MSGGRQRSAASRQLRTKARRGIRKPRISHTAPPPLPARKVGGTILAFEAKEAGEKKTILFNICGHGHFDLAAYEKYLAGELPDIEHSEAEIARALAGVPG